MPGGIEPVVDWEAEIVPVQLDQRTSQERCMMHATCKGVSLELEAPAQDGHQEVNKSVVGRKYVHEDQHQPNENGLGVIETKCPVRSVIRIEQREDHETKEQVHLANDEIFNHVAKLPVS